MSKKLLVILVFLGLILTNCTEPISEVKDTIHSAQDNSDAETHFFATFEVVYDVASTNGKLQKSESTILPASVLLTYEDSTFDDGDGIELTINFGGLGNSEPHGVLCPDGIYRAGKMHISAAAKFLSPDFKIDVEINEADKFFTGNGSEMVQVIGRVEVSKLDLTSLEIKFKDARLITGEYDLPWESTRVVELIADKGPGIWGDVYKVTGNSKGVNRFNESYTVDIDEPLIKKMHLGCAQTFVSGKLTVSTASSNKVITIDYDPYENEACDRLAEADILGRKTIFSIR